MLRAYLLDKLCCLASGHLRNVGIASEELEQEQCHIDDANKHSRS